MNDGRIDPPGPTIVPQITFVNTGSIDIWGSVGLRVEIEVNHLSVIRHSNINT